jgi:hypothetical protein
VTRGYLEIKSAQRNLLAVGAPELYGVGGEMWLVATEKHFGGRVSGVKRRKVSHKDPRSLMQLSVGGMTGGDRMAHHGYARFYAHHLDRFVQKRLAALTIVEVGILRGGGLAMWSSLFPNADIIGLDIDPTHFYDNVEDLRRRGAFKERLPEVHTFDQFEDGAKRLSDILEGRQPDIIVDDGYHSVETILNTLRGFSELLGERFVYFIEDNVDVHLLLGDEIDGARVYSYGALTVVER